MRGALVAAAAAAAAADNGWHVETGVNACNTPSGNGPCGTAKDAPGFHFAGTLDNDTACAATCEAQEPAKCPIWLYSHGSKHCWWRLDGVWAPVKQSSIVSACRETGAACVTGCGACARTAAPTPAAPTPPPAGPFVPMDEENLNGEYLISPTPLAADIGKFPSRYADWPGGARYFDLYTPEISQLYSQVFWTGLPSVPLPDEVVQRYKGGKAMAVIGFESNSVIKGETPDKDVSVPYNRVYNHHYESNMIGAAAEFEHITLDGPDDPRVREFGLDKMGHAQRTHKGAEHYVVRDRATGRALKMMDDDVAAGAVPTKQAFGGANGGESRKSFHGYAPGYAQVIESPYQWQFTPMQIDTWNRDKMDVHKGPFVAGPQPRNSLAEPGAVYSGLLECPVSTRLRKDIQGAYVTENAGTCADRVATASECFEAAGKQLLFAAHGQRQLNKTVSDAALPQGCSLRWGGDDKVQVVFNKAKSSSLCAGGATSYAGAAQSLVKVQVALDVAKSSAVITLSGPDSVWFGVGFNASQMKDAPWAVIVESGGKVSERVLADQNPGTELAASVKVSSSTVSNGTRTVVLTRPLKGKTPQHYTFDPTKGIVLPFINAVGSSATLSYHKDKTSSSLVLLPAGDSGACLCEVEPAPFGKGKGSFTYMPNASQAGERGRPTTIGFGNHCGGSNNQDLLEQRNPTCDVRTYVGGQTACHHMFSLLDADQDIPWPDQPIKYHYKWRFWYQDYNASYHTNVKRTTWGIASPVEYDVPKCGEGVTGCSKTAEGRWIHTINGTFKGNGKLSHAAFHCHAPTCRSMKMYRVVGQNLTGELICEERPVYGGTGKVDKPDFDDPGFILQPPCIWGSPEQGLQEPVDVNGATLHTIKEAYADSGHHGEMAWQQMYYF